MKLTHVKEALEDEVFPVDDANFNLVEIENFDQITNALLDTRFSLIPESKDLLMAQRSLSLNYSADFFHFVFSKYSSEEVSFMNKKVNRLDGLHIVQQNLTANLFFLTWTS